VPVCEPKAKPSAPVTIVDDATPVESIGIDDAAPATDATATDDRGVGRVGRWAAGHAGSLGYLQCYFSGPPIFSPYTPLQP
jgi:hypothetical protein